MDLMAHHAEYPVIKTFLELDRRIRGVFRLQPTLAAPYYQSPDDDLFMDLRRYQATISGLERAVDDQDIPGQMRPPVRLSSGMWTAKGLAITRGGKQLTTSVIKR